MIDLRQPQATPLIIAHRGFSSRHPDNTLESFQAAIAAGAHVIETDIRRSRDGVLVCVHDPDINGRAVADMTTAELARLNVPTVQAMLEAIAGQAHALLDVKLVNEAPATIAELCAFARAAGMEEKSVIGIRSMDWLSALRKESDGVLALGLFYSPENFADFYNQGGTIARLWEGNVTAETVTAVRGNCGRRPVWVTTRRDATFDNPGIATAESLQALAEAGVDGVLVNDITLAVETFGRLTEAGGKGIKAAAGMAE